MRFGNGRRPYRFPHRDERPARTPGTGRFVFYLRQGRVPAFVLESDPPALADELAALRRRQVMA